MHQLPERQNASQLHRNDHHDDHDDVRTERPDDHDDGRACLHHDNP